MTGIDASKGQAQAAFNSGGPDMPSTERVIHLLLDQARQAIPVFSAPETESQLQAAASARRFTLDEAKALIEAAFAAYDGGMGNRAREIFSTAQYRNGGADEQAAARFRAMPYQHLAQGEDSPFLHKDYSIPDIAEGSRWNLTPVPPGQCLLMRCLPAESERAQRSDTAFDPPNPRPYAVIEYQFDGTMNGVIHMAHEVGHAIADDVQREAGATYKDNPHMIVEMQAYLPQHMAYSYLMRHPDPSIAEAATCDCAAAMAQSLAALADRPDMGDRPVSLLAMAGLYRHLQSGVHEMFRRDALAALQTLKDPGQLGKVVSAAGLSAPDYPP